MPQRPQGTPPKSGPSFALAPEFLHSGAVPARSMADKVSQWDGTCVLILVLFCDVTHMREQDNWETLGQMQRGWRAT